MYIAAVLAILSGHYRTRRLIISHLVMAIIGSVFAFIFGALAVGGFIYEIGGSDYDYRDKVNTFMALSEDFDYRDIGGQ